MTYLKIYPLEFIDSFPPPKWLLDFWVTCGVKMMPLRDGWGWNPPQTASHIHAWHILSVWGIGMLSQGHMSAPLYKYTGQCCPQFWDFGSIVEWKWCHWMPLHHGWGWYPTQTASHIHIRHIQCAWAIGMLSQGHMGAPLYRYTSKVGPRFSNLGHLWTENDAIMSWLMLTSTSDYSHIHIRHIKCVWGIVLLSQGLMGAPLYCYTS